MAYLLGFMEAPEAQRAAGRVVALRTMAAKLDRHGHDLQVFGGALEDKLAGMQNPFADQSKMDLSARGKDLSASLESLANQANPDQQARIRSLHKTLADTQARLEQVQARGSRQPQTLDRLRREALALERRNEVLLSAVRQLLERCESALDKLALEYVEARDQQMAFALDKTEQQIAHLYEYLALQSLEETQP